MDAEVHVRNKHQGDHAADHDSVKKKHFWHAAFSAESDGLGEDNGDEKADDDDQGGNGARLLLDVMWCEA